MGHFFEIIFLALVSLYFLYRLWSVLGQETDEDKQRRERKVTQTIEEDNIVQLPFRPSTVDSPIEENLKPGAKAGLEALQAADPSFNLAHFMDGAKSAYEMIVKVFAEGDKETLKQLLTKKVYAQFVTVIDSWVENKISIETKVESVQRVDIDTIEIHNLQASIAVRFKSSQVRTTLDEKGAIIDNPAKISTPITDIWTFTRRIDSDDPNWYLAATRTETTSY